eukprot:3712391-Pyramimonas_sp.AAC.1
MAEYMMKKGVDPRKMYKEWGSYDTIGAPRITSLPIHARRAIRRLTGEFNPSTHESTPSACERRARGGSPAEVHERLFRRSPLDPLWTPSGPPLAWVSGFHSMLHTTGLVGFRVSLDTRGLV